MREIRLHDRAVGVKVEAADKIGKGVVGVVTGAFAPGRRQFRHAGHGRVAIGKEVGIESFGIGRALDLAARVSSDASNRTEPMECARFSALPRRA